MNHKHEDKLYNQQNHDMKFTDQLALHLSSAQIDFARETEQNPNKQPMSKNK